MIPVEMIGLGVAVAVAAGVALSHRRSTQPVTAAVYSASDSAGGYFDPPGVLQTYSPDPCRLIQNYSGIPTANCAINGLQLREMLSGGPVTMAVGGIGTGGTTILPFDQRLDNEPAGIIIIGAGMVDCLFTETTVSEYLGMVQTAVNTVLLKGKKPVLRGFHNFAENEVMTAARLARNDQFNAALQNLATELGVPFIDMHTVPFYGASDICADGVHPTMGYHERLATRAAGTLLANFK